MNRVWIIGSPGSGKSTLARTMADKLGLPHRELDSFFHLEGWAHPSDDEFRSVVGEFAAGDRWILDGNYISKVGYSVVLPRADTVVFPDLDKSVVMRQVVARTLRRALTREELWNTNREPLTNFYSRDPEQNIVLWTWQKHASYRERYRLAISDGTFAGKTVHHLHSRADTEEFVSKLRR